MNEKLFGGHRFGWRTIILPKDSEKDSADAPEEARVESVIYAADTIEMLDFVLRNKNPEGIIEISPKLNDL